MANWSPGATPFAIIVEYQVIKEQSADTGSGTWNTALKETPIQLEAPSLPSGNQMRKEAQSRIVAAADQWNNPLPTTPTPTPQGQMTQWAGHGNTPTPMTVIVTNPEDQKWLTQAI